MRRIFSSKCGSAISGVQNAMQRRTRYWFSAVSDDLRKIQTAKGYESDFWAADSETNYYPQLAPKAGEIPHLVPLKKQLELYNLDHVQIPPELLKTLPNVDVHSSFSTKKPYGSALAFELENRAAMKGYRSKWWVSPQMVRKERFTVTGREIQSSLVLITTPTKVYNASQLKDPSALQHWPISAGTSKVLTVRDVTLTPANQPNPLFQQHQAENKFDTCVYFSMTQMRLMDMRPQANAAAIRVIFGNKVDRGTFSLLNFSQVEGWEALRTVEPAMHTFWVGSNVIKSEYILDKLRSIEDQFPTKLWLSPRDLVKENLKAIPGVEPIDVTNSQRKFDDGVEMFNIAQLDGEEAVIKSSIGTLVR